MAPAQSLPAAANEVVLKPGAEMVNGDCGEEARDGPAMVCANNCEDNGFYNGELLCGPAKADGGGGGDVEEEEEIDVTGDEDGGGVVQTVRADDPDATEHSSSFGDTFSGSDDGVKMNSSDVEVDSQFSAENGEQPVLDGTSRLFRKKKVTAHWRKFISPLMWRCQWLELRMNELKSQAAIYDKELAAYKHEKQLQAKMIELDDSVSRSVPLICQSHRRRAMKRRKRKRNEDTIDILSYMSNHNIFSYYENKRTDTDGHSVDDDCGNAADEIMKGTDDHEWSVLSSKGSDSYVEQILLDIDALQSRVLALKTHLNEVACKNAMNIMSKPGNVHPGEPISYPQSPSCSPGNVEGGRVVGALHSSPYQTDYEMEDMVMPESAVSSYGDAADLDIIGSTIGLLSGDIHSNQHHFEALYKDTAEDVLINNQAADEELQNFEVSHTREKPEELAREESGSSTEDESAALVVLTSEPVPAGQSVAAAAMPQRPVLKHCYTAKKRRRTPIVLTSELIPSGESIAANAVPQQPVLKPCYNGRRRPSESVPTGQSVATVAVPQQPVSKPPYTGKKRGRKPKKRRGGSLAGLRSMSGRVQKLQKRTLVDRTGYV